MEYIIHRFDKIHSTCDTAKEMAASGAPEGTVIVAGEQTAGRGRLGRNWSSPIGSGLYLSLVLRPLKRFDELWQIGFVAAIAAVDAIGRVSGLPARIKWPNDILINGGKVCGILVESPSAEGAHTRPVIIGIGINVNTPDFPPELEQKATSIFLQMAPNKRLDLACVEGTLLESLKSSYSQYLSSGFATVIESWRALDCTSGRWVSAVTCDGTVAGIAKGVDTNGNLIIETESGTQITVTSGDVIIGRE